MADRSETSMSLTAFYANRVDGCSHQAVKRFTPGELAVSSARQGKDEAALKLPRCVRHEPQLKEVKRMSEHEHPSQAGSEHHTLHGVSPAPDSAGRRNVEFKHTSPRACKGRA